MRCIFFILFFLGTGFLPAQENLKFDPQKIDAEINQLDDKAKRKKLNEVLKKYKDADLVTREKLYSYAIRFSQIHGYAEAFKASLYVNRAKVYRDLRKSSLAMADLLKAEDYYISKNDIEGLEDVCITFANLYIQVNDNVKAIKFALRAKRYAEELKVDETTADVYNTLANLYKAQGQVENSIDYYLKSMAIFKKMGNREKEALLLDNISMAWWDVTGREPQIDTAWYYNQQAIKIARELKNRFLELELLANSSALAEKKGDFKNQLLLAKESVHIADSLHIDAYLIYSKMNYGAALNNNGRAKESIPIFIEVIKQLRAFDDKLALATAYYELSRGYELTGRHDQALENFKLHKKVEDTLAIIRGRDKVNEVLAKVELDQREEKIQGLKKLNTAYKEKVKLNAEKDRLKSVILYGAIILLLVIVILLVITFKRFKDNKKLSAEILLKNKVLVTKNNEITDSINYAKRIQQALLPAANELSNTFADSFILYKPKDIVSGDFYWVHKEKELLFFAVGDCTGHGVPGGFMSMLGHSFLNEVVNERGVREPAEILNQLRDKVITSLRQKGATGENKDGMDITFLVIDGAKNHLHYAAANNSFYIVRNGAATEYKADKQPIGYYNNVVRSFTQHTVELVKGDCIYLFTDGYPDQFGGAKGKKFKYSSLQKMFEQNAGLPMGKQQEIFVETFESWRGHYEQTDDVCMAGIRI
ncbi:MAG TPA: SpoIIE family protein phosphatase [Flavobacteriales bacterium]|nr:SpoIIE family protein phosphatase [Flavobacteriales bacterium]